MALYPSPQDLLKKVTGGSTSPSLFQNDSPVPSIPSPAQLLSKAQETPKEPGFISNIFSIGKKIASGVASAVATGVDKLVGKTYENVTAPEPLNLTPSDVLSGIKQTATGIGKGVDMLAKGFNEGVVRIGKSVAEQAIGPGNVQKIANNPLVGGFSEAVTGNDDISSYQSIYKKSEDFALKENATPSEAKIFSGLVVIGAIFADNPYSAPGKKALFTLSDDAVKTIARETSEDTIKTLLKKENPFLSSKELEAMIPVFREATSDAEVKAMAEQIAKIQKVPIKPSQGELDLPDPDQLLKKAEQLELPPPDVYYKRNLLSPEMELLAQEAKKFNNVEDFIKSKPEVNPAELTTAFKQANESFVADEGARGARIIDGVETFVSKGKNDIYEVFEAKTGRSTGGVGATEEEAILNAQKILGERDITEVQKAIQDVGEVSPRYQKPSEIPKESPNLLRNISIEQQPGPIADMLQKEFPTLSRQTIEPIAQRLSKLKRTSDIQGVINMVRKVNTDIASGRQIVPKGTAIIKDGQEILEKGVADLLTDEERGTFLDTVSKSINDKETAVLAQQEYEALWEHADQRIIDRVEELNVMRDIMKENFENHPGKQLQDLYMHTFKSPKDVPLDELVNLKGKKIDSKIQEILGTSDLDVAQKTLDEYRALRDQFDAVKNELKELRPKARTARMLQTMVEDVPVIAREEAGAISALAQNVGQYKDITGFKGQVRDLYRNFEAFFQDRFSEAKKTFLDPFDKAKGNMVDEINKLADDLEKNVTEKFGIKRGSPEAIAIQRYGDSGLHEGDRLTFDQLIKKFGPERTKDIIDAESFFRQTYDRLVDELNVVRAQIYPNNPDKLIQKRKDYFRHFQELGDGVKGLMETLEIKGDSVFPHDIDPKLSGISKSTKPNSKWLSLAQTRSGKGTDIDAVAGFLDYAPAFAYAKHIDPYIGKFRYLRRELANVAPKAMPLVSGQSRRNKDELIGKFLLYLDNVADDLAGKTNPMDRFVQDTIPGGRKTMKTINWVNNRVKANTILGNTSSAVAQIFHVPEIVASAGPYNSLEGVKRTLSSLVTENEPMKRSSFLKERFMGDLKSRFPVEFRGAPIKASTEQAKKVALWITSVLDEVGTKFSWNSHYSQALDMLGKSRDGSFKLNGVEYTDPVKFADDITRRIVGGRGVGEMPLIQKSKLFQLAAPFQLEVGNAIWTLGGHVNKKQYGAIATIIVGNYLMNRVAEKLRGSPVVFDPIQALIDGSVQASDEMENDGSAVRAALKFTGRQVGEILSNVPGGQTFSQAVPDSWLEKAGVGGKEELYGTANPGRFGAGLLGVLPNGLEDPLYKLALPFGGSQIKKTKEGIQAMLSGEVKDKKGNLSFKTDTNPVSVVQAFLFGKNATQEAQKYYDERDDLFQRIYRQDASRTELNLEAEKEWADSKKLSDDEFITKMTDLEKNDPALADAIASIAEEEANGLTGTERLIKMLGVENGERAKYITEQVKDMDSFDEQIQYLQNLDEKKLISDNVFEQLTLMLPDVLKK